jgi:hypothetical protein
MLKRENESASLGAEAQPGGLTEFNDVMRGQSHQADRELHSSSKAPLMGLIALAAHWMRKNRDRS